MRMASDRHNCMQVYSNQAVTQARILQEAKEVLRQGEEEFVFSLPWPRSAAGVFSQLLWSAPSSAIQCVPYGWCEHLPAPAQPNDFTSIARWLLDRWSRAQEKSELPSPSPQSFMQSRSLPWRPFSSIDGLDHPQKLSFPLYCRQYCRQSDNTPIKAPDK